MIVGTMLASLLIGSAGAIPPMEHSTAATVTQQERVIVVESRIKRGPSGAERDYGSFTVPANARAAKFSSAEPDFQIYSVEMNGREKVHFDRVKGIDRPVPLAQLTLRPGKYFFSIPGQPGASGKLTLTIIGMQPGQQMTPAPTKDEVVVVQSRITRGPSGAQRDYGSFTVPHNSKAVNFSSAEQDFQIYSVEMNGREKVHFDRVRGIDTPVPLAQLTLRPGTYFFSIPGQPGASGKLTFTIRAQ